MKPTCRREEDSTGPVIKILPWQRFSPGRVGGIIIAHLTRLNDETMPRSTSPEHSFRSMRTVLIYHDEADLDREVMTRWLASFSELAGRVVIREERKRALMRTRRELGRVGILRFADVLAFRAYYKLALQRGDRSWERAYAETLKSRYPELSPGVPTLYAHSPNTAEVEQFLRSAAPDLMIARCKFILKQSVFSIPRLGTFVLHPGICPDYRNAHGCFWALATDDLRNVGMTLLRIDKGVDTGPVFGYYSYDYDEAHESHVVIQHRVVYENLAALQRKLLEIGEGRAEPLATQGRPSRAWGQPWLSKHLGWKRRARERARRQREGRQSPLS